MHPGQRLPRRRRLPVDRRRAHVDERGPARHPPHRPGARPPARPRPRVRRGARPRVGAEPRARRVPVARRRRPLGPRPAQERARRRRRPLDGHAEPARPVRGGVGGAAHAVGHDERRAGVVAVEDDGRRRQLDRHLAKPRAAARHARADRRRRLSRRRPARLRGRRGRGRRLVPLRRRRRHVAARQRGGRATRPPVVLHARLRGSGGRRHRLGRGLLAVEVDRRRQDVRRGRHAPRRQPRPLDRSGEQPTDDRGQRRRRLRLLQQRAVVVDDLQPADRAVLPRVRRRPAALPDLRLAAGQLGHQPP